MNSPFHSRGVVRWSRGQECRAENIGVERHPHARLQQDVKRLMREPNGEMIVSESKYVEDRGNSTGVGVGIA